VGSFLAFSREPFLFFTNNFVVILIKMANHRDPAAMGIEGENIIAVVSPLVQQYCNSG
jgi:hypothetical protein